MSKFSINKIFIILLLISLATLACTEKDNSGAIKVLRIGVLPDHHPGKMHAKYIPLLNFIQSKTGLDYELVTPASYQELLELFGQKKVDLAYFGGVTYIYAHKKYDAVPVVTRFTDGRFRSMVIVKRDLPARTLHELKGMTIAFGAKLSTSGHHMPRYYFSQKNILPEEFFSQVKYSGADDKTAEWVRDGKVQAGVINSLVIQEMFLDGSLDKKDIRILWESPTYADYVWTIQEYISKDIRLNIQNAFLSLSESNAQQKNILEIQGASYYLPALHDDYFLLENILFN